MNKTFIIIMREYLSRVKKRSFLILTLITPILIAAFYVAIVWVMFSSDDKLRMIAVNNQSSLKSPLENTTNIHFKYIDNIDLESAKKEFLGGDNFYALLDIPANIMEEQKVNIYSQKQVNMSVSNELRRQLSEKIEDLKFEKIIAQTQIADLAKQLKESKAKISINTFRIKEDGKERQVASEILFGVGIFMAFFIYFIIFLYGAQVMRGVLEEKSSRIVEVIISSVKPFKLMMGKIIGIAFVSLTQIIIWVVMTGVIISIVSIFVIPYFSDNINMDSIDELSSQIPLSENIIGQSESSDKFEMFDMISETFNLSKIITMILTFIFYCIFGYLLYAALFAAIGSTSDNETDTQQFMFPVTIPLIFAIYIAFGVARNPDSNLAFWASIFPFTSPVVMPVRISYGIPAWEIVISVIVLILTFLVTVWFTAKIYRIGILMYGKKVNYKELWKWLKYKN